MDLQAIVLVVVGLLALGFIWKVISGIIRLVLTVAVIGFVIYLLLPYISR